jgi:hypothetical protein
MDLSATIAPKSDQLDAVDLLGGPRTFTIERISKNNDEQPINIHLAEFPRPWRPGLSMRRVLVACWGKDAATYVGRRVTLYCDNDVEFGGAAVGGTRIAALSHLDKPKPVPLLIKRGRSAIFVVQPLADAPKPAANGVSEKELDDLGDGLIRLGIKGGPAMLAQVNQIIEREIKSPKELTQAEVATVLDWIKHEETADAEPTLEGLS